MTDIEVRTKDPCRFCSERNLPECSGRCDYTSPSVERRLKLQLTELQDENTKLKQQLEIAKKALKLLNNTPCPLDDINVGFLDTTLKPCEICSVKNNYKCIGTVITQALAEIKKAGE